MKEQKRPTINVLRPDVCPELYQTLADLKATHERCKMQRRVAVIIGFVHIRTTRNQEINDTCMPCDCGDVHGARRHLFHRIPLLY